MNVSFKTRGALEIRDTPGRPCLPRRWKPEPLWPQLLPAPWLQHPIGAGGGIRAVGPLPVCRAGETLLAATGSPRTRFSSSAVFPQLSPAATASWGSDSCSLLPLAATRCRPKLSDLGTGEPRPCPDGQQLLCRPPGQTCCCLRTGARRVNALPPSPPILLPPPSIPPPRRTNFQKQPGQRDANKCFGQLQAGCLPEMPGPQMRHVRVQIENANFTYAATWLVTAKPCSGAAAALPSTCAPAVPGDRGRPPLAALPGHPQPLHG